MSVSNRLEAARLTGAPELAAHATGSAMPDPVPSLAWLPNGAASAAYGFLLPRLGQAVLADARTRARSCHVPVHRLVIAEGLISATDYVAALAAALDLPVLAAPAELGFAAHCVGHIPRGGYVSGRIGSAAWVALDACFVSPRTLASLARRLKVRGLSVALTTPQALQDCLAASLGAMLLRDATSGLARRDPSASARAGSWLWQAVTLAAVAGTLIGLIAVAGISAQWLLAALLTLPFLAVVSLRLAVLLAFAFARPREVGARAGALDPANLPVYTLLVPLYREARVLPALVAALNGLDYPAGKLDIKLILESQDAETLGAAQALNLRAPFELVVVPRGLPLGKPKALNYALALARGDYVCVFDAEDAPDPDQLRKAVAAFAAGPGTLGCVQAQLHIDNAGASWLSQQFALEYLALFDGLLPALDRLQLPMPLGGTSNHFPLAVLREVGGWDAWNVTEDADLGLRLARFGYRTHVIASTTFEEAPHRLGNWLAQRTRWQKGWMQTYIVHSRRPLRQLRELGAWRWFGVHAQFGGIVLSSLIYPFSCAGLAWTAATGGAWLTAETSTDRLLIALAAFNLLAGLGVALAQGAVCAIARRRWALLAAVPMMPVYWLLISAAAYRALWQLARTPFSWEKTEHGLTARGRPARASPPPSRKEG